MERALCIAVISFWWVISFPIVWIISTPYILLASIFTKKPILESITNLFKRLTRWWIISSASVARVEFTEDEIGFTNNIFSQQYNKIDIGDRLGTAFISIILMFLTCNGVLLVLCLIPHMVKLIFPLIANKYYWISISVISLIAGIVGFIMGSEKTTDIFGSLWGTNDKW